MPLNQEIESLKLYLKAEEAIIGSKKSRLAKGALGFMERHYPTRVGSLLIATASYLYERFISDDSPEEIAARSKCLIRIFSTTSNP